MPKEMLAPDCLSPRALWLPAATSGYYCDQGLEILASFILETLQSSSDVTAEAKVQLKRDILRILDYEHPYTEDDLFDRIEKVIFDWYLQNKEPIPRSKNPDLHR